MNRLNDVTKLTYALAAALALSWPLCGEAGQPKAEEADVANANARASMTRARPTDGLLNQIDERQSATPGVSAAARDANVGAIAPVVGETAAQRARSENATATVEAANASRFAKLVNADVASNNEGRSFKAVAPASLQKPDMARSLTGLAVPPNQAYAQPMGIAPKASSDRGEFSQTSVRSASPERFSPAVSDRQTAASPKSATPRRK